MPISRLRQRDDNEEELIRYALQLGFTCTRILHADEGVPDLVVGYLGETHLVEVKNPEGLNRPSAAQLKFLDTWAGAEVRYWRELEDVRRLADELRARLAFQEAGTQALEAQTRTPRDAARTGTRDAKSPSNG